LLTIQSARFERKFENPFVLDDLAERRRPRLHQRRGADDRDRLVEIAKGELHIDHRLRVHLQDDAGPRVGTEPGELDLEPVGPDGQVRDHIGAVGIGDDTARHARIGLCRGHVGAGEQATAFISHGAGNLRRRPSLRQYDIGGKQEGGTRQNCDSQPPYNTLHQPSSRPSFRTLPKRPAVYSPPNA